jgi:hypothetical protein
MAPMADLTPRRDPATVKASPSVLCVGILPLAGLSVIGAVVFLVREGNTSVPGFWLAMFFVGSSLAILLTGILVHVRWRDRTAFQKVDRVAIVMGLVAALAFAGILVSMYLKIRKLEREGPNPLVRRTWPVLVTSS